MELPAAEGPSACRRGGRPQLIPRRHEAPIAGLVEIVTRIVAAASGGAGALGAVLTRCDIRTRLPCISKTVVFKVDEGWRSEPDWGLRGLDAAGRNQACLARRRLLVDALGLAACRGPELSAVQSAFTDPMELTL